MSRKLSDYDSGLTDEYITSLGTNVGSEWPLLGVSLGFCQAQMDQIQHAFPRNVSECVIQLLTAWRDVTLQHGEIHPKTVLSAAFTEIGRADLAQELGNEFSIKETCSGQLDRAIQELEDDMSKVRFHQNMPVELDKLEAQTKQCISRWRNNSKYYVVTRAWQAALEQFTRHQTLMIRGNSGDGKSTLAYYLLSRIQAKGSRVVNVTKPETIETNYNPGDKVVFLVDDAFGTPTVNNNLVEAWARLHDKFLSFQDNRNFGLIFTTRTQVFKACSVRLGSYPVYTNHVIDLDDEENNLSEHEKKQILQKYCVDKSVALSQDVLDQIKCSSLSGFPLLCKLFAADEHLQQVKDFFSAPLSVLNTQLQILSTVEPVTYCGLVLILTHDGKLPVSYFDVFSLSEQSRAHIAMIKEACTVESSVPLTRIQDGLETLVGVYVTEYEEFYTFIHDAIFDAVTFVFGQKFPRQVLKVCSPKFLHDRVRSENARLSRFAASTIKDSQDASTGNDVLFITKSYNKDITKRFVSDINKGYLYEVFNNPSLFDFQIQRCVLEEFNLMSDKAKASFLHRRDRNLGKQVIYFVCSKGIVEMAEILINQGASVDSELLLAACNQTKGHEDIVSLLINKGVDINEQPDTYDMSAIQAAALNGNEPLVEYLIHLGAGVSAQCKSGSEAIHFASKNGSASCIRVLLAHGANPRAEDAFRRQPVHHAAKRGSVTCIKSLVEGGADINMKDAFGDQAIHLAAENHSPDVIQYLMDIGADPSAQNKDKKTPLHNACKHGRMTNADTLISKGASLTIQDIQKRQAVHHACISTNYDPKKLSSIIDNNINDKDSDGRTPLHHACRDASEKSIEKVKVLLELGANVHASANTGMQALMYACDSNSVSAASLLIAKGADVQARRRGGRQSVHFACAKGNTKLTTLLIENGADPRARISDDGMTPIHFACWGGNVQLIKMLLDLGIDVNERDEYEFTPLFYACYEGCPDIARMLLEHGADSNCTDYKGRKPVDMLKFRPCDDEIRKMLQDNVH